VFGTHTLIGGLCHRSPPFFKSPNMKEQESFMHTGDRAEHQRGKTGMVNTTLGSW